MEEKREIDPVMDRLLKLFLVLNFGDILSTEAGLRLGAYEANPIGRWILDLFGVFGLYILKGIGLGLVLVYYALKYWKTPRQVHRIFTVYNLLLAAVIAWNMIVLFQLI